MGLLSKIWNWFWRSSQETQSPQEQNAQGLGTQQNVQGSQGLGIQQNVQAAQGLGTQQNVQDTQGLGTQQNVQDVQDPEISSAPDTNEEEEKEPEVQQEGNGEKIKNDSRGANNLYWILRGDNKLGEQQEEKLKQGKQDQATQEGEKEQREETVTADVATPAVPGIGQEVAPAKKISNRRLTGHAINHMIRGKWNGTEVSGCHNEDNFLGLLEAQSLKLEFVEKSGCLILYRYETEDQERRIKTVYDPKEKSDDEMLELALEAMQSGRKSGDLVEGKAGGITFRGYLDKNGNVNVVFPIIPGHC